MPKVSVVIPAYNAMKFLPETMANALEQSYKDFEIILVNDGSSDNIQEWFLTLNNPQIKLISQENKGLSGARNTGILNAQGDYIALLDADDLWSPSKLEKQVQIMDSDHDTGLVYTWTALINEQGELTGRYYKRHEEGKVWRSLLEFNMVGCGSVPLVRRSCFDTVGLFDENLKSFVEDWDLWLRIARKYNFRVVKEPLVYYRQRRDSASRNWEAMEKSYQIVVNKVFSEPVEKSSHLKLKCEGLIYLNLAWMALQGSIADFRAASRYQLKAIKYYPGVILRQEFWRLSSANILARCFGGDGYQKFRSTLNLLRNRFSLIKS